MGRIRPARFVATLALVAVPLAACDLLLDVDKLGDGETSEAGGDAAGGDDGSGDDGSMPPPDGGADAVSDVFLVGDSRPPPDGSIPKCVPAPPGGVDPLAVTWTSIATPPTCPPGYTSPATLTAFADFASQDAKCALGSCACPGPSGTGACSTEMEYYDDAACMVAHGAIDQLPGGACVQLKPQGANYAHSVSRFNGAGVSCPPTGAAATTKPPPVWGTAIAGCKRDPSAMLPSCGDGGLVPMTPTNEAFACYTTTGACVAPYVTRFTFDTTTGYTDTRACQCTCQKDVSGAACAGGSIDSYPMQNCGGSPTTFGNDTCRTAATYGATGRVRTEGTPPAGAVTCSAGTNDTGQATPASPTVTLCCLGRCDGCKINVVLPGNACQAPYDACSADPDCAAYRACVVSMCGGSDPCASCQSMLDASAATITLFDAIGTCVTTQCASQCP